MSTTVQRKSFQPYDPNGAPPFKKAKLNESNPALSNGSTRISIMNEQHKSSETVTLDTRVILLISPVNPSLTNESNASLSALSSICSAKIMPSLPFPNLIFNGEKTIPNVAFLVPLQTRIDPPSSHDINLLNECLHLLETNKSTKVETAQGQVLHSPLQPSSPSPPSQDDPFEQAKQCMNNEELPSAINYFSKVSKKHPKFDEVQYYTGLCHEKQNNRQTAKKHYFRVPQNSPLLDDAEFRIGFCFFKEGNSYKAKEHFRNVQESSHPAFGSAQFYHGKCCEDKNQYTHAIKHFQKVPDSHPLYGEAQYKIGNCYVKLNQLSEASIHYRRVPPFHPEFGEAHFSLGILFFKSNNLINAQEHFDKVPPHNPRYPEAYNYIASIRWINRTLIALQPADEISNPQ